MSKLKLKIPDYDKFKSDNWKILLIDNGLFLYGEWDNALTAAGMEVLAFPIRHRDCAVPNYYRKLTAMIDCFRPDLVFNINFMGFDPEGRLAAMFRVLNIPILFWLIDHPYRFLPDYATCLNERNRLMVIDPDWQILIETEFNLKSTYLPLAVTDIYSSLEFGSDPLCEVSFVGTTGIDEIEEFSHYKPVQSEEQADEILLELATRLSKNSSKIFSEIYADYLAEKNVELDFNSDREQRGFQLSVIALADFLYRKKHLNLLTAKDALLYGDERWRQFLPDYELIKPWPDLNTKYNLYHNSKINVQLSSFFLSGSFNRRFLEIPLCGGFVVTDYRKCYEEFYQHDVYKCFTNLSGLGKVIEYYLAHPKQRKKQQEYAKNYILSHHLYQHRVEFLKEFILQELTV